MKAGVSAGKSSIYVVTAGASILGNLKKLSRLQYAEPDGAFPALFRDWLACIGDFPDRTMPADLVPEALELQLSPSVGDGSEELPPSVSSADDEALRLIAERLAPSGARPGTRGLSAELSSLFADGAPAPGEGDHVVLVVSDSGIGVRCAGVVGAVLHKRVGGSYRRVDVGKPGDESGLPCSGASGEDLGALLLADRLAAAGITVAVVEGLTADSEYAVGKSASGIALVLGSAYAAARSGDRRLVLHPIGGYKATIPLFTALAAHLPTQHGVEVEMWANHEQTPIALHLPFLRLGVPDAEYWDLQDLEASVAPRDKEAAKERPVRLRSSRWDGYAWREKEEDEGGFELTDVGKAIIDLRAASAGEPSTPNRE